MVRGGLAKNEQFNWSKQAYNKAQLSEGPELLEIFGLEIFTSSKVKQKAILY